MINTIFRALRLALDYFIITKVITGHKFKVVVVAKNSVETKISDRKDPDTRKQKLQTLFLLKKVIELQPLLWEILHQKS